LKVIFLGTGSGMPTLKRNVSSIALIFRDRNKIWLFDCGEGTQQQLQKADLKLSHIEKIFITHIHGDHTFGLPGLLASRGLQGGQNVGRMQIFGPEIIADYLNWIQDITKTYFPYQIEIKTISPDSTQGVIYEEENFLVRYLELAHHVKTFAYSVEEKEGKGHFLIEKARQLNIPPGPVYKALKRGEKVCLPDGRMLEGKDFIDKVARRRKIVICGDTFYCRDLITFAEGADLLIHEATFSQKEEDLAQRNFHSTPVMAAQIAKEAKVKKLILTHISSRYRCRNKRGIVEDNLLLEARGIFDDTILAVDFMECLI